MSNDRHKTGKGKRAAGDLRDMAPFLGSTADPGSPLGHGLYDPALDKDSCGVGFIADIKGRKSHLIVEDGLRILCNLEHRGATGADRAWAMAPEFWCRYRTNFSPRKQPS
jgi:hypothetical protein